MAKCRRAVPSGLHPTEATAGLRVCGQVRAVGLSGEEGPSLRLVLRRSRDSPGPSGQWCAGRDRHGFSCSR